jgi:hypothetical protein
LRHATSGSRARRLLAAGGLLAVITAAAAIAAIGSSHPASAAVVPASCANNASTDTGMLRTAINGSHAGDEIVIQGTCLVNGTISLLGDRTYRGQSRSGTVVREANGANLPALLASDSWVSNDSTTGAPITVENLTMDGNSAGNPSAGDGLVIRSWHTTVQDVDVTSANRNGIVITDTSQNGTALTNTQVNGVVRNVFVTDSKTGAGIYVQDSGNSVTDWNLLDNWVASSGTYGIRSENAAGWTIERNHVYGVGGAAGISVDRLYATCLCDNYVEDFKTNGIEGTVQGDAASVISGNRVFEFSGAGAGAYIAVTGVNYGHGFVTVTGNAVNGDGTGTGLSYQAGSHALTVTSTGNAVTNVATQVSHGSGVAVSAGV